MQWRRVGVRKNLDKIPILETPSDWGAVPVNIRVPLSSRDEPMSLTGTAHTTYHRSDLVASLLNSITEGAAGQWPVKSGMYL